MNITPDKVQTLMRLCLAEGHNSPDAFNVQGIVRTFRFDPRNVESCSDQIKELLMELPENFMESKGGGWDWW